MYTKPIYCNICNNTPWCIKKKTHHISTNTCRVSIFSTYWYLVPQSSRVTHVQARSQFEHLAGIRLVWGTLVVTPSTLKEKKTLQSVYRRQPQTTTCTCIS